MSRARRDGRAESPADPATLPACGGCAHWLPTADPALGRCVQAPPDHVSKVTQYGPLCVYRVTESTLPACGRFAPK